MNINEQLNELGKIGGVGYSPTDATVDDLVGRTRQARGRRQVTAALIGSVGAVALGIIGAQVVVGFNGDDAGGRNRAFDDDYAFLSIEWKDRYGEGYTGLGVTQDDLTAAWDQLQAGAAVLPTEPDATGGGEGGATCGTEQMVVDGWVKIKSPATGCEWKKDHRDDTVIPDGSFLFGNGQVYQCQQWTDAATGTTFWGAYSGSGDWAYKMIQCDPNDKYWYDYKYMGSASYFNTSTRTCTGASSNYLGAPHRVSCRTTGALWEKYGEWSSANGGNMRWTLNNEAGKILQDGAYKWFASGSCVASPWAAVKASHFRSCEQKDCDGGYYLTSAHPSAGGHTYTWNGSTWAQDPDPEPDPDPTPTVTPTDTPTPTPTPEPEPEPSPTVPTE